MCAGKNATEAFEDVGHSPEAREMQKKYLIGEVDTPAATEAVKKRTTPNVSKSRYVYRGSCIASPRLHLLPHPQW